MLTPLDIYDDDSPNYSPSLLEQWKDGQGMVRSALRVGLMVGSVVGVAAAGVATAYTSNKEKLK